MTLDANRSDTPDQVPAATGRTLLLVLTAGAECRSVVTALADAHGRAVVVPPHRLLAAAAERPGAPIAILTVSPQRAAEEAMACGLSPSAACRPRAAPATALAMRSRLPSPPPASVPLR